uniref:Uncharacterized protein n=1 Tax=Molossus molossus TaxID=27622 RepID=A0A7J8GQQ6_MOLMO|nr:hypothetical protein HJG59_011284 [Molossus molossus]
MGLQSRSNAILGQEFQKGKQEKKQALDKARHYEVYNEVTVVATGQQEMFFLFIPLLNQCIRALYLDRNTFVGILAPSTLLPQFCEEFHPAVQLMLIFEFILYTCENSCSRKDNNVTVVVFFFPKLFQETCDSSF